MIKTAMFTIKGVAPMLHHNVNMADPLGEAAKAMGPLTKKRNKTDEQLAEIRRLEWLYGMVTDEEGRPSVREDQIMGFLVGGAKKWKLGKVFKAAVIPTAGYFPIKYDGPKDLEKLYETPGFVDYRMAKVGQSRIPRTRPRFNQWETTFTVHYDDDMLNFSDINDALEYAGTACGVGDFKPRFGRFVVTEAKNDVGTNGKAKK